MPLPDNGSREGSRISDYGGVSRLKNRAEHARNFDNRIFEKNNYSCKNAGFAHINPKLTMVISFDLHDN